MKRTIVVRLGTCAATIMALALVAGTATASAAAPVTKTFFFIQKPPATTKTLFNIDGLLVNARCTASGSPVVYAFSSSTNADLFGRVFDGLGRLHIIKDTSFVKGSGGDLLSTTSGDFDASGSILFETIAGKVVTVDYALDNSTTLFKKDLCTVFGSVTAT
ncbi:MAG: hypothetical protein WAL63_05470 [Solirubrobacteraceae bacterium]